MIKHEVVVHASHSRNPPPPDLHLHFIYCGALELTRNGMAMTISTLLFYEKELFNTD